MIKKGQLLFILVFTFLVVVAWVGFSIYHTLVTSTISPDLQLIITPINPEFDSAVLEKLKSHQNVAPLFQLSDSVPSTPSSELNPSEPSPIEIPTLGVTPTLGATPTFFPRPSPTLEAEPSPTPRFELNGQ